MLRFKLDENADPRWRTPLEEGLNHVSTVAEEGLQGADDGLLAQVCQRERFCLITANLDFAHTLKYPPAEYAGLLVLRHPKPTLEGMFGLVRQIAAAMSGGAVDIHWTSVRFPSLGPHVR